MSSQFTAPDGRRVLFLHIPKTGATWVETALKSLGFSVTILRRARISRHGLRRHYGAYDFAFTFVRHPLAWYRSWWCYQTARGWPHWEPGRWHPWRPLEKCASETFAESVEKVLAHEPGYLARSYEWFVGPPGAEVVDYVGRTRRLAPNFIDVLGRLSVNVRNDQLPPPVNQSQRFDTTLPPELQTRLLAAEAPALRRFYPEDSSNETC